MSELPASQKRRPGHGLHPHEEPELVRQLRRTLGRLEAAMGTIQDGLAITDARGALIWCNQPFTRLCGRPRLNCLGEWIGALLPPDLDGRPILRRDSPECQPGRSGSKVAVLRRTPIHVIELRWDPVVDEDPVTTVYCVRDISMLFSYQELWDRSESLKERSREMEVLNANLQESQLHLARQIRECPVTGLPNRRALMEHLDQQIALLQGTGRHLAVLFCDVNRFKDINDTYGHDVGDELLIEIGRRLRQDTHHNDLITRLGGDEFVIVSHDLQQPGQALEIADRLQHSVGQVWSTGRDLIHPSLSIGIAMADDSRLSGTELLRRADLAMYAAKAQPYPSARLFDDAIARAQEQSQRTLQHLRTTLAEHRVELQLQPIRRLHSGEIWAQEARLSLAGTEGSLQLSERLLSQAERMSLLRQLGEQILQQVLRRLQDAPAGQTRPRVAIGVSRLELLDAGYAEGVLQACAGAGVDPGCLQLNLTDITGAGLPQAGTAQLQRLRQAGIRIHLESFGGSCSSLSLLSDLPLDGLGLAPELCAAPHEEPRRLAVLQSLIALCTDLGLQLVARGIADEAQRQRLIALGCDYGQGPLLEPPPPS